MRKQKDGDKAQLDAIVSQNFVDAAIVWLNEMATPAVGLCNDRSCIRCRLQNIVQEIEKRFLGNSG